jgi:hypothetical protein
MCAADRLRYLPPPMDRPGEAVFVAGGLSKVLRMGEVEVHALRGVDLEIHAAELIGERKEHAARHPRWARFRDWRDRDLPQHHRTRADQRSPPAIAASTSASCSSSTT